MKTKTKGIFTSPDTAHNPTGEIISTAVINYLGKGTPVRNTVMACTDIKQFLIVRTVKGTGVKDGVEIGKAIRWYMGTNTDTPITYKDTGNKVPKSEGAVPCMDLPPRLPEDIDYDWYIKESMAIIDMVNVPCQVGRNKKAEELRKHGYSPAPLDHKGKTLVRPGFDFSGTGQIGTQTGYRAGLIKYDGKFYILASDRYPSSYTKFTKKTGIEVVYGGVQEIPEPLYKPVNFPWGLRYKLMDHMTKPQLEKLHA